MPQERLTSHIRFSRDLKKRLKVAAAENGRSLNEEVVARLELSFEFKDEAREKLKKLLVEAVALVDGR